MFATPAAPTHILQNATIRPATAADIDVLVDFNMMLTEAGGEPGAADAGAMRKGIRRLLHDARLGQYFLAEYNGLAVAQLLVSSEWNDIRNGETWWIRRVFILPEFRGSGLFRRLLKHVEQRAQAHPGFVRLTAVINFKNHRSQRAFERAGLEKAGYRMLKVVRPESPGYPDPEGVHPTHPLPVPLRETNSFLSENSAFA